MGTARASMWATIYFTVHKIGPLIPKYGIHLPFFLQFIDNIIGIWIGEPGGSTWEEYKEEINNTDILTWEFVEPAKSMDFLDLTILIKNNQIVTRTYQKALNLYQYISPMSTCKYAKAGRSFFNPYAS